MELNELTNYLLTLFVIAPRVYGSLLFAGFLGRRMMTGVLIRNGIIMTLVVYLVPMVHTEVYTAQLEGWHLIGVVIKEVLIGFLIGFMLNIPFWLIETIGFFVDNHRGGAIAASMNFLSDSFASPLSGLFAQAILTVFFVGGYILIFLKGLFLSYQSWPITTFIPDFTSGALVTFLVSQFATMIEMTVMLSLPVMFAMFLAEFGFAMVSRFSPQLNVYFMAMPVKSVVGMGLFVLYFGVIMEHLSWDMFYFKNLFNDIFGVIGGK